MMKPRKLLFLILFLLSLLLPFAMVIMILIHGSVPFWYDPARDLNLALANFEKLSLIGQTSGIPGIFYGPYWIWFLSLASLFSHDPRVIIFMVLTLPYFTLFPLLLYRMRHMYGLVIVVILWLLFIFTFFSYTTQLWNPHLAPLLCLFVIYLLTKIDFHKKDRETTFLIITSGLFSGLLMNIHISFGLAVICGSMFFLLVNKRRARSVLLFCAGVGIIYVPFLVFEVRHGFLQMHTLFNTLTSSTAVVKETSIDKLQIIEQFFDRFAVLLHVNKMIASSIGAGVLVYCFTMLRKKKMSFDDNEKRMLLLLVLICLALFAIYLSTKNPVWSYHFIGVEIIFLLILGIIAKKIIFIKYLLIVWAIIIVTQTYLSFLSDLKKDPYKQSSLITKEHIIKLIYDDANGKEFAVFTYSPAHFTPDYDYLFYAEGNRRNIALPSAARGKGLVYIIIPWTTKDLRDDFIDNRTPNEKYITTKQWKIADETLILKRILYEK